jgi:hypothetical protein
MSRNVDRHRPIDLTNVFILQREMDVIFQTLFSVLVIDIHLAALNGRPPLWSVVQSSWLQTQIF